VSSGIPVSGAAVLPRCVAVMTYRQFLPMQIPTEEDIITATKAANAWNFIQNMPKVSLPSACMAPVVAIRSRVRSAEPVWRALLSGPGHRMRR